MASKRATHVWRRPSFCRLSISLVFGFFSTRRPFDFPFARSEMSRTLAQTLSKVSFLVDSNVHIMISSSSSHPEVGRPSKNEAASLSSTAGLLRSFSSQTRARVRRRDTRGALLLTGVKTGKMCRQHSIPAGETCCSNLHVARGVRIPSLFEKREQQVNLQKSWIS